MLVGLLGSRAKVFQPVVTNNKWRNYSSKGYFCSRCLRRYRAIIGALSPPSYSLHVSHDAVWRVSEASTARGLDIVIFHHRAELVAANLEISWSFMVCGGDVKHQIALIQLARIFDLHSFI